MVGCWSSVSIGRIIYNFLYMCPFDYTAIAVVGRLGSVNRFNDTSWMSVVTLNDRPKSVRNRCVIEFFGGVFVLSIGCWIFCWYRGFRHRTESNLVVFLLLYLRSPKGGCCTTSDDLSWHFLIIKSKHDQRMLCLYGIGGLSFPRTIHFFAMTKLSAALIISPLLTIDSWYWNSTASENWGNCMIGIVLCIWMTLAIQLIQTSVCLW